MLYSTKITGTADIQNAIKRNIWFPVIGRDRETFHDILDYLAVRCSPDTWKVKLTEEHGCNTEWFSLEKPTKELLLPYHEKTEICVNKTYETKKVTDTYRCTPKIIDILNGYENFFMIEDEIDIAFYENETCILYTINHENGLFLDPTFFQNLTSVIESEKQLGEHYFSDYHYCTKNALPYGMDAISRETYTSVFKKIFPYCDTFSLVQKEGEQKKTEHDLLFWKIPDAVDPKNPEQWPTEKYRKNVVDVITYSCCREAVEVLLNLPELCTLEMIFSRKKSCVAYTIPAEKKIVLDVGYFLWEDQIILDPDLPWES